MDTALSVIESLEAEADLSLETVEIITGVEHLITLEKQAGRSLDDNKSDLQISQMIDAGASLERIRRGWRIRFAEERVDRHYRKIGSKQDGWTYRVDLYVECKPSKLRTTLGQEFDNIVAIIDAKAQLPANRWRVAEVDGVPYVPREVSKVEFDPNEAIGYAPFELPDAEDWGMAFDGVYGLEDYTTIIYRALAAAEASNWTQRVNVLLYGPPACGKSEICKRILGLLGPEVVLEFDATSTTMAGAQQMLSEREEMPRVLIVEEIEKAPEASLQWLLSVLDLRGEIRKTTARGSILKDVHMIGIATVNNIELFEKMAAGALSSRFAMPLMFNRPTREILWRILDREIRKCEGDLRWIEPALDFAEELDLTDPRKIIALTVTGREKLLDNTYQAMILRTMGGKAKRAITAHFESEKG